MHILLIEDDPKISAAIAEGLQAEHFTVRMADSGEKGFFELGKAAFDLVILDIMLPACDGFEVLDTLRKRGDETPILVLTAKDDVKDRVHGLNLGADDYLVKPFDFTELLARVHALIRRNRTGTALHLKISDLKIDLLTRKVQRAGQDITLTAKEYELLEYLMRRPRQIVSRDMLAKDVWRDSARVTSLDNVIDVHVARLRKKIDLDRSLKLIHTVRGAGFTLSETP